MKNIGIDFTNIVVGSQHVELVERKGIGHPDSICDGVAESVCRALSKEYLKRFGIVMHHNTDQVELVAGQSKPNYGGGEIVKPIYLLLSGRATTYVGNEWVPIGRIAVNAAREYIEKTIPNLDVRSEIIIDERIGQGSTDLRHVFESRGKMPNSNDTSFGVGFAPLTLTENLVLNTELYINEKLKMKEIGQDIKVMGVRNGEEIILTIAVPAVSKYISDFDHYVSTMEELKSKVMDFITLTADKPVKVYLNTADDYKNKSVYLTVSGTSAEQGDDGSVGRGNRANGLITPFRPMSAEATSGKNPVNHVGKLYNLLANEIANEIAKEGAKQVHVRLMSQIGKPINNPLIASIELSEEDKKLEAKAKDITEYWLDRIQDITMMSIEGKLRTF